MHDRPDPGQTIVVYFQDGSSKHCNATMIWSGEFSGIMIYHNGKAIDESTAVGWMPTAAARQE
jgi:hypothetical protein